MCVDGSGWGLSIFVSTPGANSEHWYLCDSEKAEVRVLAKALEVSYEVTSRADEETEAEKT